VSRRLRDCLCLEVRSGMFRLVCGAFDEVFRIPSALLSLSTTLVLIVPVGYYGLPRPRSLYTHDPANEIILLADLWLSLLFRMAKIDEDIGGLLVTGFLKSPLR